MLFIFYQIVNFLLGVFTISLASDNETIQRDWVLNKKDFCIELLESLDKLSTNNKTRDVSAEIISCLGLVAVLLVLFILEALWEKIFSLLESLKNRLSNEASVREIVL